jgi:hypothetical protein
MAITGPLPPKEKHVLASNLLILGSQVNEGHVTAAEGYPGAPGTGEVVV